MCTFIIFGLVAQILAWCCAHSRDSRNIFFWKTIKIISKHTYSFCWNFQHPFPYGFTWNRVFPCSTMVKNLPANAGDAGDMVLIPGSGISPRRRNRNPLQHSCLENPIDRGTWWACYSPWVHKSQIWLSTHTGYGEYGKKAIFSHLLIPILKLILSAPHENHVFFTACIIKKITPFLLVPTVDPPVTNQSTVLRNDISWLHLMLHWLLQIHKTCWTNKSNAIWDNQTFYIIKSFAGGYF